MFKRFLIPSDGSERSLSTARAAIALAKESGATVHTVSVYDPVPVTMMAEYPLPTMNDYQDVLKAQCQQAVDAVKAAADAEQVACACTVMASGLTYQAIIDTAKQHGCDLIVMASHGRRGIGAMLLGSETQKVLTHSDVPVLVYR
jgi:nucleotide-binding universal stress UspA family protein